MIIQGSANITAAGLVRPYQPPAAQGSAPAPKEDLTRRFDSVTISGEGGRHGSFELELRSKLSQETRASASASSETIAALREQVRSGAYRPDPVEIARKMLLRGEIQ